MVYPSDDKASILVSNKAVLVRVAVTTTDPSQPKPGGSLRVETTAGALVQELPLATPSNALPAAVPAVPSFDNVYSAVVPANLVVKGLRLTAAISNGQKATTIVPRVGGGYEMTLVAVPVRIQTTTGQVVANADSYVKARSPVASVVQRNRAVYTSSAVTTLPVTGDEWSRAFGSILGELNDLRVAEGASRSTFYYGFIPKRIFGLTGLGYRPGRAAVGADFPDRPNIVLETLQHELGHNFSLPHAACGGATGSDPEYPYTNAMLGGPGRYIWGYNADTRLFTDPRRADLHDLMSYCSGSTFSDYNYQQIQANLVPADADIQNMAKVSSMPQELLMISGRVEGGKVSLKPLKALVGVASELEAGPYTLRVTTAQGSVDYRFNAQELDHDANQQHFAFTIPNPGAIIGMTIEKSGVLVMQRQAKTQSASPAAKSASGTQAQSLPQVQVSEQNGTLSLAWDSAQFPYLTVTHVGAQRTVLGQDLQGGKVALPLQGLPGRGSFEFSLSDGLNPQRLIHNR